MRRSPFSRVLVLALLVAGPAQAYPWMVRHGYTNCSSCHVDPSGAGLLKPYGRAQAELLIPALYGKKAEDLDPKPGLFFGLVPLPGWFNAGLSVRPAELYARTPVGGGSRFILMVADARLEASVKQVHVVASVGYAPLGANLAAVTGNPVDNVVSREHYVAVDLADEAVTVRAGRVQIPFGLRNLEHNAWVRQETRTDNNEDQTYGGAVAYNSSRVRAEVMGVAGNFLQRQYTASGAAFAPDQQERGYSGYAELALASTAAVGLSSLVTHASVDRLTGAPNTLRQAHGLFARWAVVKPVVLLAEADALLSRSDVTTQSFGVASFLQADYEPVQGVHVMLTGENLAQPLRTGLGGWVSASYYVYTYCELRVDTILRNTQTPQGAVPELSVLGQLHLSL